jgi:hypothetical protein
LRRLALTLPQHHMAGLMGRNTPQLRAWAAVCFFWAHCNVAAAVRLFHSGKDSEGRQVEGFQEDARSVAGARAFVQRWGNAFQKTGSVADAAGRGRKPKVPHHVLVMAADAFKAGWCNDTGESFYYTSIMEALDGMMAHPYLVWVKQSFNVGNDYHTLLRHMMEVDADLCHAKRSAKHKFSPEQKQKRIAYCQGWLAKGPAVLLSELLSVVWIDSKKGFVGCTGEWVWTSRETTYQPDFPVDPKLFGKVALNFYIAVNALIGPVSLVFVSGTTGKEKKYKVSYWGVGGVNLVEHMTQPACPPARARLIALSSHTMQ